MDATEYPWRVGIFLDALKRGEAVPEAARLARESMYDYSTLTQFEREWARLIFFFYTFAKKNTEATFKALAGNPERVTRAARYYSLQPSLFDKGKERFAGMPEQDVARFVMGDMENDQGEDVLFSTSPMSTPEGLMMLYHLLNIGTGGLPSRALDAAARKSGKPNVTSPTMGESAESILGMVAPYPFGANLALFEGMVKSGATSPGSNVPLNISYANKIPFFLMNGPMGNWIKESLNPVWVPITHGPGDYAKGVQARGFTHLSTTKGCQRLGGTSSCQPSKNGQPSRTYWVAGNLIETSKGG